MNLNKAQVRAGVLFVALGIVQGFAAGCSDSKPEPRLDVADTVTDTTTPEWIRKKRMLRRREVDAQGREGLVNENANVGDLAADLASYCNFVDQSGGCGGWDMAYVQNALCQARTALAVANLQAEPVRFPLDNDSFAIYDQPDEYAAVGVAKLAAELAEAAVSVGLGALNSPASTECAELDSNGVLVWKPYPGEEYSWAVPLATLTAEAYHLGISAYERWYEATLNTSDDLASQFSSPSASAAATQVGVEFSRAAAAHALVGGDPGLIGGHDATLNTQMPLCSGPGLAPRGKLALGVLRDAALGPDDYSSSSNVPLDLVAQRLNDLYKMPTLTSGEALKRYYGLGQSDFDEAKAYIQKESSVFARSTVARTRPPGTTFDKYVYAGSEPRTLPAVAWAARARYSKVFQFTASGLTRFISEAHIGMRDLLGGDVSFKASGETGETSRNLVRGALGPIVSSGEYQGHTGLSLYQPEQSPASLQLNAEAHGFTAADKVRVVVGEDGLRCAVEGSIEGASCGDGETPLQYPCPPSSSPTLACLTLVTLDEEQEHEDLALGYGFSRSVGVINHQLSATASQDTLEKISSGTRFYFVKARTPSAPATPGNFVALNGYALLPPAPGTGFSAPVVPSVDEKVAKALGPDPKFCARSKVSCAGVAMDERIPLEDELSTDGDAFENSWRHYLDLAKQAAAETDLLGKEYIQSRLDELGDELSIEQRREERQQQAEESIREVQSLCGTAIDPRRILTVLSASAGGTTCNEGLGRCDGAYIYDGTACASDQSCPGGYTCLGGRCVFDYAKMLDHDELGSSPDARRLKNCLASPLAGAQTLGDNEGTGLVTLGVASLCISKGTNDPTDLCPPDDICAIVKGEGGCPPNTVEAFPLNFFQNEPPRNLGGVCSKLRELRTAGVATPERQNLIDELRASNALHPTRLRSVLKKLQFKAKFGGYAAITEDGQERYSTGSITRGPSASWPCGARPQECPPSTDPNDPSGTVPLPNNGGFFCNPVDCTNTGDRADMNYKMLRAVLAANLLFVTPPPRRKGTTGAISYYFMDGGDQEHVLPLDENEDICTDANTATLYEAGTGLPLTACETGGEQAPPDPTNPNSPPPPAPPSVWRSILDGESTSAAWISRDGIPTRPGTDGMNFGSVQLGLSSGNVTSADDPGPVEQFLLGGLAEHSVAPGWAHQTLLLGNAVVPSDSPGRPTRVQGIGPYWYYTNSSAAFHLPDESEFHNALFGADFLNGLELLCQLTTKNASPISEAIPAFAVLQDIDRAAAFLKELASKIESSASSIVFAGVPESVYLALRDGSPTGEFGDLGGEMAAQAAAMREAFFSTQYALPTIASSINQMEGEITILTAQLRKVQNAAELIKLDRLSTVLDRTAQCATAMAAVISASGSGGETPWSKAAAVAGAAISAAATCANSAAQISIAYKEAGIQVDNARQDGVIAQATFGQRITQLGEVLQKSAIALSEAFQRIDQTATRIDQIRNSARAALAKAVYLQTYQSEKEVEYHKALGTLSTFKQERYKRSLKNAQLLADLAKRAIEQRLGVDLAEMREELPLVSAPSSWEGSVCTMQGLGPEAFSAITTGLKSWDYVNNFIGDYVNKLELVVESYRIEHKFHEGRDVAVISLRDDVKNVRRRCEATSLNLLRDAGQLGNSDVWRATGCAPVTVNDVTYNRLNCVAAVDLPPVSGQSAGEDALSSEVLPFARAKGFSLQFGDGAGCLDSENPCGWQNGASLSQSVFLHPGRYRLTWFSKNPTGALGADPDFASITFGGQNLTLDTTQTVPEGSDSGEWRRKVVHFKVETAGDYEIGFGATLGGESPAAPTDRYYIAAPMLEQVLESGAATFFTEFQNTSPEGTVELEGCEDTNGDLFRLNHWTRSCVHLCDGRFSDTCATGPEYCYRELSFGVVQPWIQLGRMLKYSGFARGNYNYRVESLAVNFVGSGTRNCDDSLLPNTCFNAGFVPYSMQHTGPFYVRNHANQDYRAYLFDGRIEHARGLALERYLTNPLSSTDRELVQDYVRTEFQGRPLDGNFVMRVWEEPGVDFDAIQDVQLVLNYRYWTPFD